MDDEDLADDNESRFICVLYIAHISVTNDVFNRSVVSEHTNAFPKNVMK
jgi:hypothetical protein